MIHLSVPEGKTGLAQLQPAWKVGLADLGGLFNDFGIHQVARIHPGAALFQGDKIQQG